MRTYGGLGRFILEMGQPAVDALRRMEAKGLKLTPYNLRHLETLLTPDARHQVAIFMNSENVRLQDLDKENCTAQARAVGAVPLDGPPRH